MAEAGDLGGASLASLCERVLHFRSPQQRSELIELMSGEGIGAPSDLLLVSEQSLETKLATHASFTFIQLADVVNLRSAAEQGAPAGRRDHGGGRDRSRSNGRDDQSRGRDGGRRGDRRRRQGEGKGGGRGGRGDREERPRQQKPELWRAVEEGDESVVRLCLSRGDDAEEKYLGWSPLMKAAEEGHTEIMQLLFEKRVDLEVANRKGRTALSFAAAPSMKRSTPISALRLLLENGADMNRKDDTGLTPKEKAEKEERHEAILLFEEYERAACGHADAGSET